MTKGQVVLLTGGALATIAIVYFGFIKEDAAGLTWLERLKLGNEGDAIGGGSETQKENFEKLLVNTGLKPTGKDSGGKDVLTIKFNGDKNVADFYTNSRVWIYMLSPTGAKSTPRKATYSDGGKTFLMDKDGSQITKSSVFATLLEAIK